MPKQSYVLNEHLPLNREAFMQKYQQIDQFIVRQIQVRFARKLVIGISFTFHSVSESFLPMRLLSFFFFLSTLPIECVRKLMPEITYVQSTQLQYTHILLHVLRAYGSAPDRGYAPGKNFLP
jgi:hypothetical protein